MKATFIIKNYNRQPSQHDDVAPIRFLTDAENILATNFNNPQTIRIESTMPHMTHLEFMQMIHLKPIVITSIFCSVKKWFSIKCKEPSSPGSTHHGSISTIPIFCYPFPNIDMEQFAPLKDGIGKYHWIEIPIRSPNDMEVEIEIDYHEK